MWVSKQELEPGPSDLTSENTLLVIPSLLILDSEPCYFFADCAVTSHLATFSHSVSLALTLLREKENMLFSLPISAMCALEVGDTLLQGGRDFCKEAAFHFSSLFEVYNRYAKNCT